jgi:hypothetical protein
MTPPFKTINEESIEDLTFSVFPVPASDHINVQFKEERNAALRYIMPWVLKSMKISLNLLNTQPCK